MSVSKKKTKNKTVKNKKVQGHIEFKKRDCNKANRDFIY